MRSFSRSDKSRPTLVDVARHAKVSIGTTSRVINGFDNVSPELRERVNSAIAELRYRPNTTAQVMRRGHSRLVGIVVRDMTVPILAQFVKSATDTLAEEGYSTILVNSDNDINHHLSILDAFSQRGVEGLIAAISSENDAKLNDALLALDIPVVLLDRDGPADLDGVAVDHRGGTQQAIEHLLSLGHVRIALITGEPTVRPAIERIHGYEAAYKARGLKADPKLICTGSFTSEFAHKRTASLLSESGGATAIFAGGIAMLPGVLFAIREQGLRIPDDVSLISGGGDSDLAQLVTPAITSVRWDYARIGSTAANILLRRMQGKTIEPARRIIFPTDLIIRGSVKQTIR